jgi:hypothetical protein
MRKFWIPICTIVLGSTLTFGQATSNSGGGQTSNPVQDSPAQATCQEPAPARAVAQKFLQRRNQKLNPTKRARTNITRRAQKLSRDPTLAIRAQNDFYSCDNKAEYSSPG